MSQLLTAEERLVNIRLTMFKFLILPFMNGRVISLTLFMWFSATFMLAQDTDHPTGEYKFIENGGQWPEWVCYNSKIQGGQIWLETAGVLYDFLSMDDFHDHIGEEPVDHEPTAERSLIYAEFVGANEVKKTIGSKPSAEHFGYFIGNDESKWATGLKSYQSVLYPDIYDGIDLLYFESEGKLKYEYRLQPGADPTQIKTKYYGESSIRLSASGSLITANKLGQIIEEKPFVYQIRNGKKIEVESAFILKEDIVSFHLGNYDSSLPLIIDPVLVFATYSGAPSDNFGMTATFAYDGSAYSAGMVFGNDYPAPGNSWNDTPNITVFSTGVATTDVFVSKYSADGTNMIWTNFVGGGDNSQGTETVHSLICDKSDNIYLFGVTSSIDFPVLNAYQSNHAGGTALTFNSLGTNFGTVGTDIYVTKISADGLNLLGSTYLGGSANDGINYKITSGNYGNAGTYDSLTYNYGDQFRGEIMLDSMNNVLIATNTRSADFPTVNPFQGTNAGQQDGVVFKLSADFSTLIWSSYLGGSENDACYSLKLDTGYNVIVVGGTSSNDLPGTIGGLNPGYLGGVSDGFIVKLTPDGATLTQSTYMGTASYDQVYFVDTDANSDVYVVGQSNGGVPVVNALYSNPSSGQFVAKIQSDLATLDFSTVFGSGSGSTDISPSAFAIDDCENLFVSGWGANILQATPLSGMPITANAFQPTPGNGFDFYLIGIEKDAESLIYGSYIGGSQAHEHVDGGTSRFDDSGVLYQSVCGGCGGYSDFPVTPGAWSSQNLSTNCNNLVFKFDFHSEFFDFQLSANEGCIPFTIDITNLSADTVNYQWIFPTGVTVISAGVHPQISVDTVGAFPITLVNTDPFCNSSDSVTYILNAYQAPTGSMVSNDTTLYSLTNVDLLANSFGTGTNFTWYDNPQLMGALVSGPNDSTITVNPTVTTTYYVVISNGWIFCDIVDSVTVTIPTDISTGETDDIDLRVYPNPFDDQLIIESPVKMEWIRMMDVHGKVVAEFQAKHGYKELLKTSELPGGTYIVQITFIDKTVVNRTLVNQ